MTPDRAASPGRHLRLWASMFVVYILWATSCLAIKQALAAFPPILMGGLRSLLAGAVLYALARWRSGPGPKAAQWRDAGLVGVLAITFGSSLLAMGVLLLGERLSSGMLLAMALVLCGVAITIYSTAAEPLASRALRQP